jgi:hypothetical protein
MMAVLISAAALPALACGDKDEQASFPMKSDAFQQKVDGKIAKIRARTEDRLKDSGATAEQAKQERARVETVVATIQSAAKSAMADGVVTAEEAKTVRAAGKALHKGHRKDANKS